MTEVTATVQYVVDGTTHDRTFTGHRVSSQIIGAGAPGLALIQVYDTAGEVVETWQGYAWTIHKARRVDTRAGNP